MKSKLFKTMVLTSSLVFMNCGDDSVNSAINNYAAELSSSSDEMVQPESTDSATPASSETVQPNDNATPESSATAITPESSTTETPVPESSNAVVAESSADVAPTSSTVAPASSDNAPSSSSSAMKPASSSSEKNVSRSSAASSSSAVVKSSSSEAPKPAGVFLAEGKDEDKEQLKIVYQTRTGWDGGAVLSYPEKLSDTQKHAVVIWGPGGGGKPEDCEGIIRRLASHGFVVVGIRESPGNATQGKASLDWLEKKNKDPNDPLYNKLDMTKVGAGGHSMGGLEAEQLLIQDSRVITAMLSNSGDLGHTAMTQVSTSKTISIVYGCNGFERPNAEADYNNPGVKAPACLIMMDGADYGHGSGFLQGKGAFVAWMRWHLGGEDFRKADFVGTTGKYINGSIAGQAGHWKGQCKNF